MKIVNFSEQNSIINQYLAEIRDKDFQQNRLLFRNNIQRIGELMAYEISKDLHYVGKEVVTPLGTAKVNVPDDQIVLATIFRAGLPLHQGFLNVFDQAENAFVSAYRKYKDEKCIDLDIHIEYLASPNLEEKTLIIADPMLATGGSMELGYQAFATNGIPKKIHIASVIATQQAVDLICHTFPQDRTTIWCAAIDPVINEHKYIVPGLGDAGDLAYGEKI
jgi:uracil phosphoribosyltransferase